MKTLIRFVLSILLLSAYPFTIRAQKWEPLGYEFPLNRMGQINGIERVTQLKFHPTDPKIFYGMTAMGGLFISKDEGANWSPTGTDNLPFCRLSSVCIDHTNPRTMYIGTGDPNYYNTYESIGIYKSIDGGQTWTSSSSGLGNALAVEILMSPSDNNVLIAATNNGIWKSTNAGATWTVKKSGGEFTDMIFKPGAGSTIIYASTVNQFWISTNLGDTWTQVSLPTTTGISNGGRIGVTPSNPNIVYLSYVGLHYETDGVPYLQEETPILKSTNSGSSFTVIKAAGSPNLNGYDANSGGQGNYNYDITVDPLNSNILYAVGHCVWKSIDGGLTWTQMSEWANKVHTDMRHIVFSPFDPSKLYNANDGGIWVSTDGGWGWTQKSDGLAGLEIYHAAASPIKRAVLNVGTQDNGEVTFDGKHWVTIGGGDNGDRFSFGYYSWDEVYSHNGNGSRKILSTTNTSSLNFPFTSTQSGNDVEMEFTALNPNLAFIGQNDLYRTTTLGSSSSWTKINSTTFGSIKALALSPTDANVLYVVTADGKIRRSDNAQATSPTFVTYNTPAPVNIMASVAVIKSNTNIVYMTCGSRVFRSADRAASWTEISGSLPLLNIFKIHHDVFSTDESVYIGTAKAVYYRNSGMSSWLNYSAGLPTVADINDFMIFNDGTQNSELYVAFKGRGVWRSSLYNRLPVLRVPENPAIAVNGLSYKYYEGTWGFMPNFNSLATVKTGSVTGFDLTPRNRDGQIGFVYTGYVDVPTDGQYTFYTSSDDGSQLYIGKTLIVNNDGEHAATEKSGSLGLKAGKHAIAVYYFNNLPTISLSISFSGPGITKQVIPSTVLFRNPDVVACTGTGSITREYWSVVSGNSVDQIPVTTTTTSQSNVTSVEEVVNQANNFGVRQRGYICAPYTGSYKFWIGGDESTELWLSSSASPATKVRVAYSEKSTGLRDWFRYPTQESALINLVAGQKYYIEALQKEGEGDDNLSYGWQLPTGEFERPIPASRLSPMDFTNKIPVVSITSPASKAIFLAASNITVNVTATDPDGSIAKVEFYKDGVKVGEDLTSPYSLTLTNVAAGSFNIVAAATDNLGVVGASQAIAIKVLDLRNPENPTNTLSGLDYSYYEGSWSSIPDFSILTAVKTGTISNFDLTPRNRNDNFAFRFKGFVNVPADGLYTFYTDSDDGSNLYIGNELVVDNDGLHGAGTHASGVVALKAGKHAVTVNFFEQGGDESINVYYESSGITKQLIPSASLFRVLPGVPPTVSITAPLNNATFTVPASVTISANAADSDGSITRVEFYQGTTKLGEDLTSPYSYSWTNVAAGTYVLKAVAFDNSGSSTTSSLINITVSSGNVAPTVSITSPLNNATFTAPASVTINANASDSDGSILKVEFYQGTTKLGEDLTSPYSYTWTSVAAGTYTLKAIAYDNATASTTSSLINITVSSGNVAPTVSITSPLNNTTFTAPASVTINANASDSDGSISKVEFYQGNTKLGEDLTSPYSYTWTSVAAGTYTLKAIAYDNATASTTSSLINITVTSGNVAPTVSITSPLNNATFTAPASVTINANASDSDGSISKVEFYQGTTKLGEDLTSPYSYTWTSVAAGTYVLTAIAYDNSSATTTSSQINITVSGSSTAEIIGPDCGTVNGSAQLELNSVHTVGANTYSWYANTSVQSITPVSGQPYKVNILFGANFTGGQFCVGVNYNGAPYYQQFCKNISVCSVLRVDGNSEETAALVIAPNPSEELFTLKPGRAVAQITVTDVSGHITFTQSEVEKGKVVEFGKEFSAGVYAVTVKYKDGSSESVKVIKK
ncbi:MAG: Ig-like domain-containing protein [Sporocytophaga sp.]|nr:Ig-like domain-containing protein [Sporocytophaga sp.]